MIEKLIELYMRFHRWIFPLMPSDVAKQCREEFEKEYGGIMCESERCKPYQKRIDMLLLQKKDLLESNVRLRDENKELEERNNRQAQQLDNLYHLIEEEDWGTLTGIINDFKECEEQLQREWECYE